MSAYAIVFSATLIWLVAVINPGPNFLVVSRLALSRSRTSATGATFRIAAGSLIYAALTLFGLSVLILRFAWLGEMIRVVGGAYLVWLGIQAWRATSDDLQPAAAEPGQGAPSLRHGLRVRIPDRDHQPEGHRVLLQPVRRRGAGRDPIVGQAGGALGGRGDRGRVVHGRILRALVRADAGGLPAGSADGRPGAGHVAHRPRPQGRARCTLTWMTG